MKILAKLLVGFIGVAILCAIVGIVGITQLATMSKDLTSIEKETIPSIVNILAIEKNLQQIKVAIRSLAIPRSAEDLAFTKRQLDNIEKARAGYKKNIEVYEPIPRTADEEKLWKATQAALAVAASYNNELIAMAERAEKTGIGYDRDKIYEDLYGSIAGDRRVEFDNAITAIAAQSDYVVDFYGVKQIRATTTAAIISETILVVVTIISFLVAIVLGILLGRSISNPLKKSVAILDKMAAGDISERFVVKSKDEFALVAASLGKVGDSIGLLIQDASMLAKAAVDGKLATRADASKHQGDYKKVVDGVNQKQNLELLLLQP
ncbi:MAG: MCP four helix bundle domain-containing protein, partial [Rectinemataceae bacterium]